MNKKYTLNRTSCSNPNFKLLVTHLDKELFEELQEDQATYDQYNLVPNINTAVIVYDAETPIAIGCYKHYTGTTVEIKRMFVNKEYRGKGISKLVLTELENWALENGYSKAILETSRFFNTAISLYTNAGYKIIANYDQYKNLADSICFKKELLPPSEFKNLEGIEYFNFEEDFVEDGIRCIPMAVRFKLDATGIKLQLNQWSKFSVEERVKLALLNCHNTPQINEYNKYLEALIIKYTGQKPTPLAVNNNPEWANTNTIPPQIIDKIGAKISISQWQNLTNLQRFALCKLSRQNHESKNLPKAIKEFGINY
jgi:hypothetical protein